ncbi:MAG TPA: 1-(5-phosphoribosyl)-5-[(5-phosphoribosylamino)methylideneamino]imidazole-4-carboxamide isomerase [Candidatus Coprenecus stercoravium]|uniref:1-(5-phosphoribosyl)-5-[(5-phosphoribosylamino)methylideneamino] imidazole-4-carboxamide isomerase n=1 Tax=Candidatus Coprenecus stercoravium TaxID=2840735 RepID=A0A9D2GPQ4_9BACT|nr:1-(5-phosphoribosyl)-5-[(5-phosphoribosylamino)methylideneamino]imidazole-4-carboxamide isomerase [Candidatus Coprenecus stercoravium]
MIDIIPAIDVIEGRCVRLSEGDYGRCRVYDAEPLDMAKAFEDCGAAVLHLVDLEGAKSDGPVNLRILEKIASRTALKVEFGGGVKSDGALRSVFDAGAFRVIGGSIACTGAEIFSSWLRRYGGSRIVLGADVRNGKVSVNGWLDKTDILIEDLLRRFLPDGLETVIVTDISKDGMLAGPTVALYSELMTSFPDLKVAASGGVGSMADISCLEKAGVRSVIVGKAIYENRITLPQLAGFYGRTAAEDNI